MIKEDLEQEKFNKELEEKLKVNYPEFENKCDEVYKKCVNNKHKFFWNNKLLFIPCATIMLAIIMLIIILDLPGSNKFTKLCDGVYVSSSSLDLDGEIDMSICEGIEIEEYSLINFLTDKIVPKGTNAWVGFPFSLNFDDEKMYYEIYCDNGYILYNRESNNSIEIGNNELKTDLQWSPFKSNQDEISYSKKIHSEILKKCDDTFIYILCKKNNLYIGAAIMNINIYDISYWDYGIEGKIICSYKFKNNNKFIGINRKQVINMINKSIKNGEDNE